MGIKERRVRERQQRSREIVDAAEKVIFSKGIQNATMDDIAKEAELGKATLYVYYNSKDEILLEIRTRAMRLMANAFREAVKTEVLGKDKIQAIGRAYFKFAHDFPNYYQFISLFEAVDAKIDADKSLEAVKKVDSIMHEAIEVGHQDGSIRKDLSPQVLGKCLWAMSTGIMQMIDIKGDVFKKHFDLVGEEFMQCFFNIMYRGLSEEE